MQRRRVLRFIGVKQTSGFTYTPEGIAVHAAKMVAIAAIGAQICPDVNAVLKSFYRRRVVLLLCVGRADMGCVPRCMGI